MDERVQTKPDGEEQPADDDKNKWGGKNWTLALLKADPKTGQPTDADVDALMKELFGPEYGEKKDGLEKSSSQ